MKYKLIWLKSDENHFRKDFQLPVERARTKQGSSAGWQDAPAEAEQRHAAPGKSVKRSRRKRGLLWWEEIPGKIQEPLKGLCQTAGGSVRGEEKSGLLPPRIRGSKEMDWWRCAPFSVSLAQIKKDRHAEVIELTRRKNELAEDPLRLVLSSHLQRLFIVCALPGLSQWGETKKLHPPTHTHTLLFRCNSQS